MVRVRELEWSGAVEGLGDGRAMPLPDGTVGESVARAIRREGAALVDGAGPALVVPAGTALGPTALRAAWALGVSVGRDCRIHPGGRLGELLGAPALASGGLAWVTEGRGQDLAARVAAAESVELDPLERRVEVELFGEHLSLPLSDRVALPVRHWVQLLWANLLLLGPHLWHTLLSPTPAVAGFKLGFAALRALSMEPEPVMGKLVRRARDSRVHPRAVVEASVLGPGSRVGAGAVVRGCVLGPGARVEELALCEGVVMGAGAVAQRQAMLKFGVMGEGSMIGGVTQLSVLGPGSSIKRGGYGMDQSLAGGVRVMVDGALVEAPLRVLGVCLGANAMIGCGVRVAPGRVVPEGAVVAAPGALTRPGELGAGVVTLGPERGSEQ